MISNPTTMKNLGESICKSAEVSKLLDALGGIVGESNVVTDPQAMEPHLIEDRGLWRGRTSAVVWPTSTDEVSRVLQTCKEHRVAVVPQGGNTGVVGGGTPNGGVVLAMGRMNSVLAIDPLNSTMTVEAGCVLSNVQAAATEVDRMFPLSLAAEGSCQIGGVLATNAGGTNVLRYGNARDLVLGLEVVLPDGRVMNGLSGLRKDNTGYDLRNLFIGSEGTLGIITAAVIKLFPQPRISVTAFMACPSAHEALALFATLRETVGEALTMFEYMERFALQMVLDHAVGARDPFKTPYPVYVLLQLSSPDAGSDISARLEAVLGRALAEGFVLDAVVSSSGRQDAALRYLRESISEAQKPEGASIKHDISVPVSKIAAFLDQASAACRAHMEGIRLCPVGHFGDGNIHFNITQPLGMPKAQFLSHYGAFNRIVHDIVADMNGSISAEHGIGLMKRDELVRYKDPVAMELMRQIKGMLDPSDFLNPGKVLGSTQ